LKDLNISVVIPNYNGVHLFPETLPALFKALEYTGKIYEIIIIDDCSTDASVDFLRQHYPKIKLLQNESNSGFSKTINKGIFAATYELVLLLNSDVKLSESYFKNQFRYFELPDTFGVMGKIIGWENEEIQDGAKYPEFEGFKLKTSLNYLPDGNQSDNNLFSLYLSGANALVNRDKLLLLGGFNELFSPFYIEDVDLSVRAWRCGFKCYFETNSVCIHKTSESIRTKEKKIRIRTIYNRNKLYFHAIHLNGWAFTGWFLQTLLELLFRLLTFRTDYFRSYSELIKNREAVKRSAVDFDKICEKTGVKLSLNAIRKTIIQSLKNKEITFFRN
jgi:GT2 family glycosyltransferase